MRIARSNNMKRLWKLRQQGNFKAHYSTNWGHGMVERKLWKKQDQIRLDLMPHSLTNSFTSGLSVVHTCNCQLLESGSPVWSFWRANLSIQLNLFSCFWIILLVFYFLKIAFTTDRIFIYLLRSILIYSIHRLFLIFLHIATSFCTKCVSFAR